MTTQDIIDTYISRGLDAVSDKFIAELLAQIKILETSNKEMAAAVVECGTTVRAVSNLYKTWLHVKRQKLIIRDRYRLMGEAFAKFEQELKTKQEGGEADAI